MMRDQACILTLLNIAYHVVGMSAMSIDAGERLQTRWSGVASILIF